jgi:hypothetical protein
MPTALVHVAAGDSPSLIAVDHRGRRHNFRRASLCTADGIRARIRCQLCSVRYFILFDEA